MLKKTLEHEEIVISGIVENIGKKTSSLRVYRGTDALFIDQELKLSSQVEAAQKAIKLVDEIEGIPFDAIGHRIVHGGEKYSAPAIIDDELVRGSDLQYLWRHFICLHKFALIEWARMAYPAVPQVACFDTWFHRSLPQVARQFPLPYDFYDQGLHAMVFMVCHMNRCFLSLER